MSANLNVSKISGSVSCPWVCPHCGNTLRAKSDGLQCIDGHSYDLATQGYVNLLLANQKNSKVPGDSADMVSARRDFFSRGHYHRLFEAVAVGLCDLAEGVVGDTCLLDIGCGEGSYLRHAVQRLDRNDRLVVCGIDISKFAIKRAATLLKLANFAVASSYAIPMPESSVDIALNVFAPLSASEVSRVLKPNGHLLRVSPGKHHLQQIKKMIYTQAREHSEPSQLENFSCIKKERLSFRCTLAAEDLAALLAMTPLSWRGSREAKQKLLAVSSFDVDFDFIIELLRPESE